MSDDLTTAVREYVKRRRTYSDDYPANFDEWAIRDDFLAGAAWAFEQAARIAEEEKGYFRNRYCREGLIAAIRARAAGEEAK